MTKLPGLPQFLATSSLHSQVWILLDRLEGAERDWGYAFAFCLMGYFLIHIFGADVAAFVCGRTGVWICIYFENEEKLQVVKMP